MLLGLSIGSDFRVPLAPTVHIDTMHIEGMPNLDKGSTVKGTCRAQSAGSKGMRG